MDHSLNIFKNKRPSRPKELQRFRNKASSYQILKWKESVRIKKYKILHCLE